MTYRSDHIDIKAVDTRHWRIAIETDNKEDYSLDIFIGGFANKSPLELDEKHLERIASIRSDLIALKRLYIRNIIEYRSSHFGDSADPFSALSEFTSSEIETIRSNGIDPVLLGYKNYIEIQKWQDSFRLVCVCVQFWYDEYGNDCRIEMWGNVKDPTGRVWTACLGTHDNPKYETEDGYIECG